MSRTGTSPSSCRYIRASAHAACRCAYCGAPCLEARFARCAHCAHCPYVVLVNHTPDALFLRESSQVALHEALLEEVGRNLCLFVHERHRVLLVRPGNVCLPFMGSRRARRAATHLLYLPVSDWAEEVTTKQLLQRRQRARGQRAGAPVRRATRGEARSKEKHVHGSHGCSPAPRHAACLPAHTTIEARRIVDHAFPCC